MIKLLSPQLSVVNKIGLADSSGNGDAGRLPVPVTGTIITQAMVGEM